MLHRHRSPAPRLKRGSLAAVVVLVTLTACSSPAPEPVASPSPSPSPATSATPTPTPTRSPEPEPTRVRLPSLKGDTRNAFAYAPLSDPADVTVEGSVSSTRAWSTSKVLVVLAFIDRVAGGDPDNLSAGQRALIKSALTESDLDALLTLRGAIPGGSGTPITEMLRSIGDERTTAPDTGEGSMQWSVRDQIRFMAALYEGKLVSKKASAYVLDQMHPVKAHSWGLGTIGASAFKGGWLTPESETRQMGIVGDYAVVIITNGVGPAVLQSDGDYAHVRQMNRLARMLEKHLEAAQAEKAASGGE